jgi:hypothetical protein
MMGMITVGASEGAAELVDGLVVGEDGARPEQRGGRVGDGETELVVLLKGADISKIDVLVR